MRAVMTALVPVLLLVGCAATTEWSRPDTSRE